ncbi:MAG: biliverdin-producing heme oxygenase [Spirochaetota bacterium]
MKTGIFGQKLTLMEELKATTFAAHAQLQTAPFFAALAACQLPLESYVGQLRALAVVRSTLERAIKDCLEERVAVVWDPLRAQLPLLLEDIRFFEPRAVSDLKEAAEAAQAAAELVLLGATEAPLRLLGFLYVLEGSSLGAIVLRPLYARAFLLKGRDGVASLGGEGGEIRVRWALYRARMDALVLGEEDRETVVLAANEFFVRLEAVYRSLYPFTESSKTFLATSINPEAGRHPIPADPREVQAALEAADVCWRRFPYYETRYGERGVRFARSDAAWLATLCAYEPALIEQQIRWLGRVLANRGMPTFLLQIQLEILAEALRAAIPEKHLDYDKLSQAASALLETRRSRLDDRTLSAFSSSFDEVAGPVLRGGFAGAGELLACAVVDQLEGSEEAVESLRGWMIDSTRFSPEWIAAVESTLKAARSAALAGKQSA